MLRGTVRTPRRTFTRDIQERLFPQGVECVGSDCRMELRDGKHRLVPYAVLYNVNGTQIRNFTMMFVRSSRADGRPFTIKAWKYGRGGLSYDQRRVDPQKFGWMFHDAFDIVYRGRDYWPCR